MRAPSRTRCECTAAVASSGRDRRERRRPTPRSERIRIVVPSHDRLRGLPAQRVERALERRGRPRARGRACSRACGAEAARGGRCAQLVQLAVRAAPAAASPRAGSRSGARRAGCHARPRAVRRLITSASRCGSMGGFVTWANCCLKYAASSCGRSRERGQRRVVAHRADRLRAVARHRRDEQPQLLGRCSRRPAAAAPSSSGGSGATGCGRRSSRYSLCSSSQRAVRAAARPARA